MKDKFKINSTEILNKKFTTTINGYDPLEVDQYLDVILSDYVNYEALASSALTNLNFKDKIIQDREQEIKLLKEEISNVQSQLDSVEKNRTKDAKLIERMNRIEEALYKKQAK